MGEAHRCRGCGREVEVETTRCPECGTVLETVVTESGGEPFEAFVASLAKAHRDIRGRLGAVGTALKERDVERAIASLRKLNETLNQHVIEEEARILKVLIDVHGREGAQDAVRTMQQHRSVHKLVGEMLVALPSSADEASKKHAELEGLLREHFEAEERRIFPSALEAHAQLRRDSPSRKP